MKKELIKLGLVAGIATSSLFGFTYEIKQGWQQLGAIKDFDDLKPFDDASCVEYLWHYDLDEPEDKDKWKLHISDGKNYNYCGKTFSSLKKGDGFWLKASGECNITVTEPNNCNSSGFPTPPSLDGSTCDANVTNPDNNSSVGTGLPATTTIISSFLGEGNRDANVSYIIVENKQTFTVEANLPKTYNHGYFWIAENYCVIKVDEPFRLWTSILDRDTRFKGKLKVTNTVTNEEVTTGTYPDNFGIKTYYQMTDTLPAGTYRFEKAAVDQRLDDGWFFEKM